MGIELLESIEKAIFVASLEYNLDNHELAVFVNLKILAINLIPPY